MRHMLLGTLLLVAAHVSFAEQKLWITPLSDRTTEQASIFPHFAPEHAMPSTVRFDVEVRLPEAIDEGTLTLTVFDPQGDAVHSGTLTLNLSKKIVPALFTWTPTSLSDGTYVAHFVLVRRTGDTLAEHRLQVRVLTRTEISERLRLASTRAAELRTALGAFGDRGVPAYAALHVALLEDYLPIAEAALGAGEWVKAADFADYLTRLAEVAMTELSVISPSTATTWAMDPSEPEPYRIEEGAFVTSAGPFFPFGMSHSDVSVSALPLLGRYGLDLAVYRLGLSETFSGPESLSGATDAMVKFVADAQRSGVRVVIQLAPEQMPDWARESYPALADNKGGSFGYDLLAPQAKTILTQYVRTVGDRVEGKPGLMSITLAENPSVKLRDDVVREGLITTARALYKDYDHMNREWKTRYMSFDEIQVDWGSRRRAYRYDLQTYHQELGTQFFSWLAGLARESAPTVPVQVQFADNAFEPQEAVGGIDRESILASMDINGCAATQPLEGEVLGMGPPVQASYYALLRSLRPLPVMNTADGFTVPQTITGYDAFRRVRTMMWEAVMAGLNGSAIDFGTPGTNGLLGRPEYVDGYATAHLDVNRLAPIVTSFQRTKAPVRILWSMSSKIFDHGDPYLASARRAYEGCSQFGVNVDFISERECEREGLYDFEVLVIPRALALSNDAFAAVNHFIERGGVVVRQGTSIPYTEHGVGRADTIAVSTRTIYIRGEDTPRNYVDALDAAYDLKGLSETPRLVNEFGYPVEGVKSRFAVHERTPYLYLVNLRETPVTVRLTGNYTAGVDLVSGNRMVFTDTIEPLTPMLIQLEGPPPVRVADAETVEPVPAVELVPTPAMDSTPVKRTGLRHGR